MEINKTIFSFFGISITIFIIYTYFSTSTLEAQYLMTSQIRARIEYLTDNIRVLVLRSNLMGGSGF